MDRGRSSWCRTATLPWCCWTARCGGGPDSRPRKPSPGVPANALQSDEQKCLAAGMNDFLPKPFKRAQLQALLARWLPRAGEASGTHTALEPADARDAAVVPASDVIDLRALQTV